LILTIISVIILILALILLSILFIPFHIYLYLQKQDTDIKGKIKISWWKIRIIQRKIPAEEKSKKKKEEKKKKKKKRKTSLDDFLKILNEFIEAFPHFIPIFQSFYKSITLKKVDINFNIGFYSPVTTALFSGCFWSISSILNLIPPLNLSITPDFQNSKLDGSLDLSIKIKLYPIFASLIRALTKKPVLKLFWSMRKLNQ
jgi:predicted Holliday junction resolvase-like endonuclease